MIKFLFKVNGFFLLCLLLTCDGANMKVSDVGRVCLFSKMSGVIKVDSIPVSGLKLIRAVDYSGLKSDETATNSEGYFEFPVIYDRSIKKLLPQEFSVSQSIVAEYEGKEYKIWTAVKRIPDENSESRGKELIVECELNQEERLIKVNNSPIFSLCVWDVEPDKKRNVF